MRFYVKIGLFFTLKKIQVHGLENIPKSGAVIFIGNHQNALIDGILIPTTTTRKLYFLSRASAFKNKTASKLLKSLNMIPVYRIRDGIGNIEKNIDVFEKCFKFLKDGKAIEIFAEGEHHLKRRVIPFKKGFARIILGTLKKYPETEIHIIPVGINYDSHLNFPCSTSIYYGNPIKANDFINLKDPDFKFSTIINKVSSELKKLTLHIDDLDNYDKTLNKLESLNVNYLNPFEANQMVLNLNSLEIKHPKIQKKQPLNWFAPLHLIAKLNSLFPLLIWKFLKQKVKEIIFYNTFRFAVILTLFPLFYLIQTAIVYSFFGLKYALVYLISSLLLGIIVTKTMTVNQ